MTPESLSRRGFVRSALGVGVVVAGAGAIVGSSKIAGAAQKTQQPAADYALIIDTTKCTGCGACREACQARNHLPEGSSYIHILDQHQGADGSFLPVQCQHCAEPPCADVCPTRATYRREDGVVMINEKLCVGCKYCELACPYQARVYDEERGVADKCWLCLDYVLEGRNPACVDACVFGARLFGRQDDPSSDVAQLVASGQAKPFHPEFGTDPSILYYIL